MTTLWWFRGPRHFPPSVFRSCALRMSRSRSATITSVCRFIFYTLMRWYVSDDPLFFPKCHHILHVLRRRWFCVISQKGRVVQWEFGHHVSCILCRFSRGRVDSRFPCRCSFLPITDFTFLFALHLERFYLTTVPFSVWLTLGNTHL